MSNPCTLPPNKSLPPRLRAGDALSWTVETDLAAGTVLFYVLTGVICGSPTRVFVGGNGAATTVGGVTTYAGIAVDATGNAAFTLPSATTAAWLAGKYTWVLFSIDSTGNRDQIAEGEIRIAADPNGTLPVDPRSDNEKLLAAIQRLIAGRALGDEVMYKVGNRELTKLDPLQLEKWRSIVAGYVKAERRHKGQYVPKDRIGIAFGGTGRRR